MVDRKKCPFGVECDEETLNHFVKNGVCNNKYCEYQPTDFMDEEEIQEAIEAELKMLDKKIVDAEKSIKSFDDRINTQCNKKQTAIKELEDALIAAKKPFEDIIKSMDKEKDEITHKKHLYVVSKNTASYRIRAKFAENLPEFPDGDSLKGFLLNHDIHPNTIEIVKRKLANGITLFRTYDSLHGNEKGTSSTADAVGYFAVKGKEIVGFIFTEKSKHPGDVSTVYCWINSRFLRKYNQLSENDYSNPPTVGFKKWKQRVSEIKIFIPIDLDDEKNQKILSSSWNIEYDAMEPDIVEYKDYTIKPKKDFGTSGFLINGKWVMDGFVVVDKRNINVMPAAAWFQTIDKAKKGIDVLIKYGEKDFWKGYKEEVK